MILEYERRFQSIYVCLVPTRSTNDEQGQGIADYINLDKIVDSQSEISSF